MTRIILSLLLLTLLADTASAYKPFDPTDPVEMRGDTVWYAGRSFVPSAKAFFVDSRLSDDFCRSHPFTFNTFNDAAAALTDGTADNPMTVYIAPGVYWVDDPDDPAVRTGENGREPFGLVIRCNTLHLVGLTADPRNVVIAAARGQTQGAWGNFTMLDITSDDFLAENLTLGNFCNVDLKFPLDRSLDRPKRNNAITQAHVAYLHGDRAVARNVRFISRLNMNPLNGARRILFDRCHMESTDDALTGTGVYLSCDLDFHAPRPFWNTHSCGAVFLDCDFNIRHSSGRQYFCKSVGPVSVIDCRYHSASPVYTGWTHYPTPWLRCYQSGVTLNGTPVTIGSERPENTVDITSSPLLEAFRFDHDGATLYNTYNLLCGDDGWDPLGIRPIVEEESRRRRRDLGAIPSHLAVTPREASLTTGDPSLTLTAEASRHAGFPLVADSVVWTMSSGAEQFIRLEPRTDGSCSITAINESDSTVTVDILASTPTGHRAAASVTVIPEQLPAPGFTRKPVLSVADNAVTVDYALDLGDRDDRSVINWYRATSPDGADSRLVAVSRYGKPLRSYQLTREDASRYIMAEIIPAHIRSLPAEPVTTGFIAIAPEDAPTARVLSTDFSTFPTAEYPGNLPGYWTVGGFKPADTAEFAWADEEGEYWYYGTGINGATGHGLSQRRKGARLMFTPVKGDYGDMSLTLLVDPAKTAGQGFGSATGQYLDVAVKFDTESLTGYALRVIRTTDFSNAVSFYLVRYDNGKVTPLTEPVAATCYRTGCTIRVDYTAGLLSARVTTSTPLSQPADPRLSTSVDISARVPANPFGGIAVQHTGSTGESATMLHRLDAEWR